MSEESVFNHSLSGRNRIFPRVFATVCLMPLDLQTSRDISFKLNTRVVTMQAQSSKFSKT